MAWTVPQPSPKFTYLGPNPGCSCVFSLEMGPSVRGWNGTRLTHGPWPSLAPVLTGKKISVCLYQERTENAGLTTEPGSKAVWWHFLGPMGSRHIFVLSFIVSHQSPEILSLIGAPLGCCSQDFSKVTQHYGMGRDTDDYKLECRKWLQRLQSN